MHVTYTHTHPYLEAARVGQSPYAHVSETCPCECAVHECAMCVCVCVKRAKEIRSGVHSIPVSTFGMRLPVFGMEHLQWRMV